MKEKDKTVLPSPTWGRSSVGRAPALQAGGQEFESLRLHLSVFASEIKIGCLHTDFDERSEKHLSRLKNEETKFPSA